MELISESKNLKGPPTLPYMEPYQLLAAELWRWQKLPMDKTPRTARWLWALQESGLTLDDLFSYLLKPREQKMAAMTLNQNDVRTLFVGPVLKAFRHGRTINNVIQLLKVKNKETYHYWETGQRDLPLSEFLKAVDLMGNRLQIFCEMVGFKQDLRNFKLKAFKEGLADRFFRHPWTPTVYLLLQSDSYRAQESHRDEFLLDILKISPEQLHETLLDLTDLEMIRFDGRHYIPFTGVFYVPPNLKETSLRALNQYWMGRSHELSAGWGLHKVGQAAVSFESREKILGWVADLREKIREEIRVTKPETVVHFHWQISDLLHSKQEVVK